MDNRWSLRKQNTGASLVAVLIAIIVVGVIGILITQLTIANIQMKEVESSSKQNFYQTEECMDEVTVKLNSIAAKCMQDAYMEILKNYYVLSSSGENLQEKFTEKYLEALFETFRNNSASVETIPDPSVGVTTGKKTQYHLENIKNGLSDSGSWLVTKQEDAILYVDYEKDTVRLKNIKVTYKNAQGYETTITTDMLFTTPVMNFSGRNLLTEYMKYSLIADKKISVNSSGVQVDGNVYAGAEGIDAGLNSSGSFTGNVIVTRGDISSSGGTLSLGKGDKTSRIWAENVCTTSGFGNITLRGNSYIADDLTMNARGSGITLEGKYYGYNFQENYPEAGGEVVPAVETVKDSDFSSAIVINARSTRDAANNVVKSKLNISGLDYLMLAGRTYISSGNSGNDVMLGESLSVRANQLAYYVDARYLDTTDPNNVTFTETGKTAYKEDTGLDNIMSYLNPSKPVISYSFIDNYLPTPQTYYYLNFVSENAANEFYAAYVEKNKSKVNSLAEEYLDNTALQLNSSTVLTLKGDILYRDAANALQEKQVTISGDDWNVDGSYWDFSKMLAINYKSLQLSLTESGSGITGNDVRFTKEVAGSTVIDKTVDGLLDNIVDVAQIRNHFNNSATVVANDVESGAKVIFVENDGVGDTPYIVPNNAKGIVVATGDVYIQQNFEGMILSGGTISFAVGANVKSNSVLVSELFQSDATLAAPQFTQYFKDYGTLLENVIGTVQVSDYLLFENWKKN